MAESFEENAMFISTELARLSRAVEKMDEKIVSLKLDIEGLKIKSGIWGAVGAAMPVMGLLLFQFLTKT